MRMTSLSVAFAVLAGCGGGSDDAPRPTQVPVFASAKCFEPARYELGATLLLSYGPPGDVARTKVSSRVGTTMVTFAQTPGLLSDITTSETINPPGTISRPVHTTRYLQVKSDGTLVEYGTLINGPLSGMSEETTYSPPVVDARFTLTEGSTMSFSSIGTRRNGITFQPMDGVDLTTTVRFEAIESVSVPAGNYQACRYRVTDTDSKNNTSLSGVFWVYRSVVVRSTTDLGTVELKAAQFNGAPL
jgi:hypothetical protein